MVKILLQMLYICVCVFSERVIWTFKWKTFQTRIQRFPILLPHLAKPFNIIVSSLELWLMVITIWAIINTTIQTKCYSYITVSRIPITTANIITWHYSVFPTLYKITLNTKDSLRPFANLYYFDYKHHFRTSQQKY